MTDHRCRRGARCVDRQKTIMHTTGWENCGCTCHGRGPHHPCDEDGGCGYHHTPPADTVTWVGALIATEYGLCPGCVRAIGYDIAHLKGDVADLTMRIARDGAVSGDKVAATREPPTPLRLGLDALRAEIDHETQAWAEPVAEALGIDWPSGQQLRAMRLGPRVQRCVDLLTKTVDTLVALPAQEHPAWTKDGQPAWAIQHESDPGPGAWQILERADRWPHEPIRATTVRDGVDGALCLSQLHHRVYQRLGRTRLVHRLPARCPWCWQRTLVRDNGAAHVHCESDQCRGRTIDERHYDWLVQATLAVEQAAAREATAA
ncbi:hypothetical protein ACFQE5_01745 [Pseudonocardia hispaniensis]|uniref:Uncharacterized protein n=1 Tax=Pseudonocardia hispaniensis TaxID=904933 RepID=A0ABW1IX89_9PSEU